MKVLTDREIIEQAKVEAFEAMKEMLEGKRVTYEAHLLSPYMIIDIFDSLNMEYNDDFETNGWQLDYWFGGTYKDKEIRVSGSGYYGGLSFYLDEEIIDE